jgi:hypothetical protein
VKRSTIEPDEIHCRLCGRAYRAITWTHLTRTHDLPQEEAVREYKRRFRLRQVKSPDLLRRLSQSARRYFEGVGRGWTKERIVREIRARCLRGLALNHIAVRNEAKTLEDAALRIFGSWDAAVEASGLSAFWVRRARSWSRESLARAILEIHREGGALNARAVARDDPGLYQGARRFFGGWDGALRAAGLDPLKVRKSRVWTREEVLRGIASGRSMSSGEAFRKNRRLWGAARKLFGSWGVAAQEAARRPGPGSGTPERRDWRGKRGPSPEAPGRPPRRDSRVRSAIP